MHSVPIYVNYVKTKNYWSDEYLDIDQLLSVGKREHIIKGCGVWHSVLLPFQWYVNSLLNNDAMNLIRDRDKWRALVNTVKKKILGFRPSLFWNVTRRRLLRFSSFRDNLSIPSSRVKQSKTNASLFKTGPIGCSEKSAAKHQPTAVTRVKNEGLNYIAAESWSLWTFGFQKMQGIFWLAGKTFANQNRPCSMNLDTYKMIDLDSFLLYTATAKY